MVKVHKSCVLVLLDFVFILKINRKMAIKIKFFLTSKHF
jgi:hypothetical protein